MNLLVIIPHPDDESIGCSGALCRHAARGDCTGTMFLTSGELGLKHLRREARRAAKRGLDQFRGPLVGNCAYAEAFQSL